MISVGTPAFLPARPTSPTSTKPITVPQVQGIKDDEKGAVGDAQDADVGGRPDPKEFAWGAVAVGVRNDVGAVGFDMPGSIALWLCLYRAVFDGLIHFSLLD